MSKRYIFPEQHGETKKAKLNVTISDHNFPLSQNAVSSKEAKPDENWGDDNDDEILLLASQACEDAYSDDISTLPDYSMCMQPPSTSTQMYDQPSPSKPGFTFKKPTTNPPSAITTKLKDKCNRISSPLPGISKVVQQANNPYNVTDDLIVNEKIYKDNDSDLIYRQLLQLQEENTKLKSENGKLLEKCVTKEGEASILRTQLKTCQSAVDNARLERMKAQEKVQLEFADKLANIKKEMYDLKTQLDFKNVEIISIKEKCKKLESAKVKLTQVTVTGNDISARKRNTTVKVSVDAYWKGDLKVLYLNGKLNPSHAFKSKYLCDLLKLKRIYENKEPDKMCYRHNASMLAPNESSTHQMRRLKAEKKESSVQTEHKAVLLKLNKTSVPYTSKIALVLPLLLEPSREQPSPLASHERLQRGTDRSQDRCRVFSTYHRLPAGAPPAAAVAPAAPASVATAHRDLASLAAGSGDSDRLEANCCNIVNTTRTALKAVRCELEGISQRMSTAFLREMDERYIDATTTIDAVDDLDLFGGSPLYKEEQAIVARRLVAALALLLEDSRSSDVIRALRGASGHAARGECVVDILCGICKLLDSNYCALLYSGLLMSTVLLATNIVRIDRASSFLPRILDILRCTVRSRPLPLVCRPLGALLAALGRGAAECPRGGAGDLRTDHEQGVLLYKSDSCLLQVYLRQAEVALKCMERRRLVAHALALARDLVALHAAGEHHAECDCQPLLIQVIIYGLTICTLKLDNESTVAPEVSASEVEAVCRAGVRLAWRGCAGDARLAARLARCPARLAALCERLRLRLRAAGHDPLHENMLTELMGTFQTSPEELPLSFHRQAWVESFELFSIAD